MTTDTRYQGWANYETWAVNLWLTNDQGTHEGWSDEARETWEGAEEFPAYSTRSETARIALADRMKEAMEEEAPELDGMWADLLGAALGEVNWGEVANGYLDGLGESDYEPLTR